MVCLARLMSTIYPGFVFRVFHLLLGRLPSKAYEFYLPKATGLKAPDIRLSPVVCQQKKSLPRVGHTSDLSVRKLYVTFHGSTGAYLRSSPRHDRLFKDPLTRLTMIIYSYILGKYVGIGGSALRLIRSYFSDRTQRV